MFPDGSRVIPKSVPNGAFTAGLPLPLNTQLPPAKVVITPCAAAVPAQTSAGTKQYLSKPRVMPRRMRNKLYTANPGLWIAPRSQRPAAAPIRRKIVFLLFVQRRRLIGFGRLFVGRRGGVG